MPKFQSTASFMDDYEAYRKGIRYKLIRKSDVEYVREGMYKVRKNTLHCFNDYVGEVDLKHKFEKVCVV
jgi:hypothetical protein